MNGNIAVVGTQWGDEGKGKIVDLLAPGASVVARCQGGHNAAHTVRTGGAEFILHVLPSGILHPGVRCVIGNGAVVDPLALLSEIDALAARGVDIGRRLLISDRAHVILPHHRRLEKLSEERLGDRRIGTTSRGVGPAYEDKAGRRGVRVADLADTSDDGVLARAIEARVSARHAAASGDAAGCRALHAEICAAARRLEPWVGDASLFLARTLEAGGCVVFEGAQGTLLDIDHGTHPFVTSSNAAAGGVCTGLGGGPRAVGSVLGVVKAYATRVGGAAAVGAARRRGRPTPGGRPRVRRLDGAPAPLRLVRRGGGALRGARERPGRARGDEAGRPRRARRDPRLHRLPPRRPADRGVPGGPRGPGRVRARVRTAARLAAADRRRARVRRPAPEARAYPARVEALNGVPMSIVSTGADRADTIIVRGGPVERWAGGTDAGGIGGVEAVGTDRSDAGGPLEAPEHPPQDPGARGARPCRLRPGPRGRLPRSARAPRPPPRRPARPTAEAPSAGTPPRPPESSRRPPPASALTAPPGAPPRPGILPPRPPFRRTSAKHRGGSR